MREEKRETLQLSNGLTVLCDYLPWAKSVAYGLFVRVGARNEIAAPPGVSHFIEHMLFRGSAQRPGDELMAGFADLAVEINAYTSEEMTVYHALTLPETLFQSLEFFSELLEPQFHERAIKLESSIIESEYSEYMDIPYHMLLELGVARFFSGHPVGRSILGDLGSIKSMSRENLKKYWKTFYTPQNAVFAISGNVPSEQLREPLERLFGRWTGERPPFEKITPEINSESVVFQKEGLHQVHMLGFSLGPSVHEQERWSHQMLSYILGDASNSRMYWELVDTGLAEAAECDAEAFLDTGCFTTYAVTSPENYEIVAKHIREILLDSGTVSDDELACAREKLITRALYSQELPYGRMLNNGATWLLLEQWYDYQEHVADLKKVNSKAISKTLDSYPLEEHAVYTLFPAKSPGLVEAKVQEAQFAEAKSATRLRNGKV